MGSTASPARRRVSPNPTSVRPRSVNKGPNPHALATTGQSRNVMDISCPSGKGTEEKMCTNHAVTARLSKIPRVAGVHTNRRNRSAEYPLEAKQIHNPAVPAKAMIHGVTLINKTTNLGYPSAPPARKPAE